MEGQKKADMTVMLMPEGATLRAQLRDQLNKLVDKTKDDR